MNLRQHFIAKERSSEAKAIRILLLLLLCCFAPSRFIVPEARAAEPFLRKGDVVALVGGEDMVVAGELGYLELLLTRALPEFHLRFRNLAWEGDTVFEQRRDLNFPPLEAQLDQVGATVVICQFGQMESLAAAQRRETTENSESTEKRPSEKNASHTSVSSAPSVVQRASASDSAVKEFIAAYETLIERLSDGGKRRVAIVIPPALFVGKPDGVAIYGAFLEGLSKIKAVPEGTRMLDAFLASLVFATPQRDTQGRVVSPPVLSDFYRDDVHLADAGQRITALALKNWLLRGHWEPRDSDRLVIEDAEKPLLTLIRAKNRLWFDYWRVQNWAFLAGDRTNQPSSRDHRDPSQRWFPAEREAFLPLIAAKEREIDALAAQLAKP